MPRSLRDRDFENRNLTIQKRASHSFVRLFLNIVGSMCDRSSLILANVFRIDFKVIFWELNHRLKFVLNTFSFFFAKFSMSRIIEGLCFCFSNRLFFNDFDISPLN